jgi:hypothetical protein
MLRPTIWAVPVTGPDHGGVPRVVAVMGAASVLPGHKRASEHLQPQQARVIPPSRPRFPLVLLSVPVIPVTSGIVIAVG